MASSRPTSRPLSFLNPPQSPGRSGLEDLKQMYFTRKYRQCITKGQQLLTSNANANETQPLRVAYLNFYIALSHDALARQMANTSQFRGPTLQLAEQHYNAALKSLPGPFELARTPLAQNCEAPARSIETSRDAPPKQSATEDSADSSSTTFYDSDTDTHSDASSTQSTAPSSPATATSPNDKANFSEATETFESPLSSTHEVRYNAHLQTFQSMLNSHISSVRETRIAHALTMGVSSTGNVVTGAGHRASAAYGGENVLNRKMSKEELTERVKRGRERGWVRPRFDPERYEEVCTRALGEL